MSLYKNMKKILIISIFIFIVSGIFSVSINARTSTPASELRRKTTQEITQKREELKEKIKDLKQEKEASKSAEKKGKAAKIINGKITNITGSKLTVSKDEKNFSVNVLSDTKFRRHFWGKSDISELSVSNIVNVWGKWTDNTQTAIDAKVKSKDGTSFTIESVNRGDQTVFFTSTTKFIDRKEKTITFADIKVGDKVRIKGMWDKSLNKITDVSVIKDFSIPVRQLTPSITTAPTPS